MSDEAKANLDVGLAGTGVMGSNLARNLARHGFRVGLWNRTHSHALAVASDHPEAGFVVTDSLADLAARLERPRRIVLMVPAGAPVDATLDQLDPVLAADDVVVDAGNSHWRDTERRIERAASRPWRFVGMGVSGGAEGALLGPSIMPGGDPESWQHLRPMLEAIAADGVDGPCVTYCGRGSAGHFVKMVHNGIEYGDMQLIAEVVTLLRDGLGQSGGEVADVFSRWNEGELASYLVEITADVLRVPDPEGREALLVDAILDEAGQKGTGRWTVVEALELGVAVPTVAAAVDARVLSAQRALRLRAADVIAPARAAGGGNALDLTVDDLGAALYASKIASYTQGLQLLAAASRERDYGTDLAEVARIWTAGCIIRAELLGRIRQAMAATPPPELLALDPAFARALQERLAPWRKVVAAASRAGIAVPGLSASLAWLETLTTRRGSAWLIQAQRDYFGSHTYRRVDRPDEPVHTDWPHGS